MDHCITADQFAVHEIRMVPGVELVVCVQLPSLYRRTLELLSHDGAAPIYFTTDNSEAEVRASNAYVVPAAVTAVQIPLFSSDDGMTDLWLRLISEGDPLISITRTQTLSARSSVT